MQLAFVGGGRRVGGGARFVLDLEGEVGNVVDHFQDGGLVVECHQLGARQDTGTAKAFQQADGGREAAAAVKAGKGRCGGPLKDLADRAEILCRVAGIL